MDAVELAPGYTAFGLTLYVAEHGALAFADTHLGYEEALNRQGVLVPHFQFDEVTGHVRQALERTQPETVVVDGDLKHEFARISEQEWGEVLGFLDILSGYDVKFVKGNHDTILGPIAGRSGVDVVDELRLGTTLFTHGHNIPEDLDGIETIVIGHEHPCVGLSDEGRVEKVKCFLVGRWEDLNLIVLPSLNFVTEGVDVLQERPLSPLLQGDISGFAAYGVEDGEIMRFSRICDI